MSSLLYIKANPKPLEQSVTFQLSESLLTDYQATHPDTVVTTLDLYANPPRFLTSDDLSALFSGADSDIRRTAQQFAAADRYLIAAPMWNLSLPAILKAYIDHVMLAGVTFKYTANGPVGLLSDKGKKAVYCVARGGSYSQPPTNAFENGERYLKTVFGFMGIDDFSTVSCENTNVLTGDARAAAVSEAISRAAQAATSF